MNPKDLLNALDVKMWEMFDFGHMLSQKVLKETFQSIAKSSDETTLRLALKVIRAVARWHSNTNLHSAALKNVHYNL